MRKNKKNEKRKDRERITVMRKSLRLRKKNKKERT